MSSYVKTLIGTVAHTCGITMSVEGFTVVLFVCAYYHVQFIRGTIDIFSLRLFWQLVLTEAHMIYFSCPVSNNSNT